MADSSSKASANTPSEREEEGSTCSSSPEKRIELAKLPLLKPPTYGGSPKERLQLFLLGAKPYLARYVPLYSSEAEVCVLVQTLLKDEALEWAQNWLEAKAGTPAELTLSNLWEDLSARFAESSLSSFEILHSAQCGASVRDYITLFERHGPFLKELKDRDILTIFVKGLPHHLQLWIIQLPTQGWREACKALRSKLELEESVKPKHPNNNFPSRRDSKGESGRFHQKERSPTSNWRDRPRDKHCYVCGETTHLAAACSRRTRFPKVPSGNGEALGK